MSKVLRVVAVVASLAATVGSLGAFGGIALAIVGAVATVAAIGAQLLQKRPERAERQAQEISLSLGEQPRTVLFGDAVTGGGLLDAFNYGGKYGTDWEMLVLALADHECAELTGIYVNNDFVAFGGDGDVAGYNGKLKLWWRPGTENQDLPSVVSLNGPGWTANDNLAGVCFAVVAYKSDQPEEENPTWPGGRPSFRFRLKGKKLYDPRKDSTVTGGSGLHRWDDPATREWSDNAALCRYNYQRGIFALEKVAKPDQLLLGRGLSAIEAPPERAMVWANLCDEDVPLKAGGTEKRYRINGVISTDENFLDAEQKFAAAMAGIIMQPEGSIEVEPGHAKSVIAEFTDADILNLESVVVEKFRSEADSEWYNMVVPRYVEPSQNWKMHGGPIRRVYADVIEDGGVREAPLSHELVTSATQSQRCAEIVRRMGRLTKTGQVSLPPRFIHVEEGDWIGWTSDRHFEGSRVVFRVEKFNRSEKWHMSLVLREIGATVFGWDPNVDELTGGAEATNQTEPPAVGQPGTDAWTLTAGSVASPNGTQPALEISGAVDDDYASAVRFEYKKVADADWSDAGSSARTTTRKVIAPVSPNTQYIIGVTYTVDGEASERRTYGPVTTGNLTIDFANVGDIPGELTDGRIPSGLDANGNLISGINTGGPLEVTVEELAGNQSGNELAKDPDFARGLATSVYNTSGGSAIVHAIVADTSAPNASKKKLVISYDGVGPTNPGFGGFTLLLANGAQAKPGYYVEGAVIQYYIIAKIPVGRSLTWASNAYGTGGTFSWLTSVSGAGAWKTYMAKQVIGYGGTLSTTGFFYVSGGTDTAFDWEIARCSAIHQGVAPRAAIGNALIDDAGDPVTEAGVITSQGNSLGFIGEGVLARENAIDAGGAYFIGEVPVGKANVGLRNTNVTIGSNGLLTGAGGGQVTYSGVGGKALGLKDILTFGDAEFREAGATVATTANFKTALGNSAGFIGEGALARENSIDIGGAYAIGELPVSKANVGLRNTNVTIGANGLLTGAGGGQVTYSGVGGKALGLKDILTFGDAEFREAGTTVATTANFKTALGNSMGFIGEGALARKNAVDLTSAEVTNKSLANLDAAAAAKLADARSALAGALPAQFNAADYWNSIGGGSLPVQNLKDNPQGGYVVDSTGRSVTIGPVQYAICLIADLPISDGMIYEFSFDVEVVDDGGGTSVWGFIRELGEDLSLITSATVGSSTNLTTGQRRMVRFRIGKNTPGLVNLNITDPLVRFIRVLPLVNRAATNTGTNALAITKFFGITGSVDFATNMPITRLTEDGTAGVTLSNFKTALGNAIGFIGEGALARLNSADWASQISGTGKPSDGATRNQEVNNLIDNAVDFAGYLTTNATYAYLQTLTPSGPVRNWKRFRFDAGGGSVSIYPKTQVNIPVRPGEILFCEADFYRSAATGGDFNFLLDFYDSVGTFVATVFAIALTPAFTNGVWTTFKGSGIVPVGAAFVRTRFNSQHTSGTWYIATPYVGRTDLGADVTKSKQITFEPVANYNIQADSNGQTTTSLPEARTVKILQGGVLLSSGVVFSMHSVPSGLAASIGSSTGIVSLSTADAAGTLIAKAVYDGVDYFVPITVNRTVAAPISGGGSGSSSFIDQTWNNISTTSDVQVTDVGAKVQSDASGQIRYSASGSYSGSGGATLTLQYSLDGSAWTNFAAAVTGSTAFPGEPGYVSIAATTKTGLTASTDYFVRAVAKRSGGSGTLSWTSPIASFYQP